MFNKEVNSILDLIKAFPNEQSCIDHLEILRWNDNIISPFDSASKVFNCKGNKYKCKNTIEGFWSLLKRGVFGIYHFTSKRTYKCMLTSLYLDTILEKELNLKDLIYFYNILKIEQLIKN